MRLYQLYMYKLTGSHNQTFSGVKIFYIRQNVRIEDFVYHLVFSGK